MSIHNRCATLTLCLLAIASIPFSVHAAASSTIFSLGSCPVQKDLATYVTSEINDYLSGLTSSDATKKIFSSANVRNPDVWTNHASTSIDLTGVSPWNSTGGNTRSGTLISPRHIVFANHYQIATGATLTFVGNDNSVATRTLVSLATVSGTDIAIGLLDSDVPNSIAYYPILLQSDLDNYFSTSTVERTRLLEPGEELVTGWFGYS